MPWTASDEAWIAASHQILEADMQPEPLHGHNWRVRVFVRADRLDERGLVVDFRVLKKELAEVLAPYDHRHLNDLPDFQGVETTAEELARLCFQQLAARLDDGRVELDRVEVWMTDTGCAEYSR